MSNLTIGIKIGASLASGFKSAFSAARGEIQKLEASTQRSAKTIGDMYKAQSQRYKDSGGSGLGTVAGAAGLAAAFTAPIKSAISFETAMLGVAKQVEGARDASGKLTPVYTGMRKEIQLLGREIPLATNELAAMVEAGARMGVAKNDLIGFTRNAAIMATAFELPAAQLADDMGKIANLYKIPIPTIGELGDVINYLDDKSLSKGGDIINYLSRVGGVAGSVKITGQNMAALGSTLLSLGETTETAGTATNAIFQKFAAAESGTKAFKEAMGGLGLSLSEVQKGMQADAQGTLLKVLDAINKMPNDQRIGILADLVGLDHSDTLAKLAVGVEEYRKQIELAGSQDAEGSMSKEFAARLQTTNAQMEIMGNLVGEVGVNFGTVFLPMLNSVLEPLAKFAAWTSDTIAQFPVIAKIIGTGVAAIGAYAAVAITATGAQWAWNAAMSANPLGMIIAATTALGIAAYTVYSNWEAVSRWIGDNVFARIESGAVAVKTSVISAFDNTKAGIVMAFDAAATAVKSIWEGVISWFTTALEKIGNAINFAKNIGGALWNAGKGAVIGAAMSGAAAVGLPVNASPLPQLPAMKSAAINQTTHQQNTINITQQPGQNSKTLAKDVADELMRRQTADQRRALHD